MIGFEWDFFKVVFDGVELRFPRIVPKSKVTVNPFMRHPLVLYLWHLPMVSSFRANHRLIVFESLLSSPHAAFLVRSENPQDYLAGPQASAVSQFV